MQVVQARATFVTPETVNESLTTIVARSVLEAALKEEESAELWFELGTEDGEDVSRLSIDLSYTDIEDLLRLSSEDEIALTLDGEAVESLFGDPDVEGHGLKGAIAIAVTSAAILAPASQAAVPQATASATQQAKIQATAQVGAAATAQVSSLAARTQVSLQAKTQVSKSQVAKVSGLKLLRSGLAR
jgi:hypothetical protein